MFCRNYNIIISLILVTLLCHTRSYGATANTTTVASDTVATTVVLKKSNFKPTQLIAPGALIAVGTFGAYNSSFKKMNEKIKDNMTNLRGTCYYHADDYIQYLPVATYVGIGFTGIKSRYDFRDRLLAGSTAYIAMAAIVNATKYTVREKRPDANTRNSFPSGHTATAFTGAELCRLEYGNGVGAAAYAVATTVAFMRLYNGRHWFNDVLAGAGVGILSANIGYWMLPLYRKWFKWDKDDARVVAVPAYNAADRSVSIGMVCVF